MACDSKPFLRCGPRRVIRVARFRAESGVAEHGVRRRLKVQLERRRAVRLFGQNGDPIAGAQFVFDASVRGKVRANNLTLRVARLPPIAVPRARRWRARNADQSLSERPRIPLFSRTRPVGTSCGSCTDASVRLVVRAASTFNDGVAAIRAVTPFARRQPSTFERVSRWHFARSCGCFDRTRRGSAHPRLRSAAQARTWPEGCFEDPVRAPASLRLCSRRKLSRAADSVDKDGAVFRAKLQRDIVAALVLPPCIPLATFVEGVLAHGRHRGADAAATNRSASPMRIVSFAPAVNNDFVPPPR